MISWETTEPEYLLGLEWSTAADGTPICYDDGAQYDSIRATLTGRLTKAELEELETAYTTTRGYDIISTGYLLGPEIDTSTSVHVALLDLVVDGPTDSSINLYDVTITVAYGPLDAPPVGDLTILLSGGVPYHSATPSTLAYLLCDGDEYSVTAGRAIERECKWYAAHLSHQDAASVVRALRNLRGDQATWYPNGGLEPWGPGIEPNALIWITDWQVVADSPMTWGVEATLVRGGAPPETNYIVTDLGENFATDAGDQMIAGM